MTPWPDVLERQLLQLPVGLVQAQPVRDRRVDVERFAGDAGALGQRHGGHGAHVVQPVRQLDENDAHVTRHRQQHLAERLGLRFLAGRELQPVEFGQAIHQIGGRRTEAFDQLGLGDAAIFHRVVHQRGHDGLRVKLPVRTQPGDGDWVGDVGLTAGAKLTQMRTVGEAICVAHPLDVGCVEVIELVGQRCERSGRRIGSRGFRWLFRATAEHPRGILDSVA